MEDPIIVILRNIRLITVNLPLRLSVACVAVNDLCGWLNLCVVVGNSDEIFEVLRDTCGDWPIRPTGARAA